MTPINSASHSFIFSAGNKTKARAGVTGGEGLRHDAFRSYQGGGTRGTGPCFFSVPEGSHLIVPESAPSSPHPVLSPGTPTDPDGVQTFLQHAFHSLQQTRSLDFRGPCLSVGLSH